MANQFCNHCEGYGLGLEEKVEAEKFESKRWYEEATRQKARADKYADGLRKAQYQLNERGDLICPVCKCQTLHDTKYPGYNHAPDCAKAAAEKEGE